MPRAECGLRFSIYSAMVSALYFGLTGWAMANEPRWVQWIGNGHWYAIILEQASWNDARLRTDELTGNAHLATITSQAENNFVYRTFISDVLSGPWIGGFQPIGSPEPAGAWQWVDDEPFLYTNWALGEPNNAGDENCLEFPAFINNVWNDLYCDEQREYIIESESAPTADIPGNRNTTAKLGVVPDGTASKLGIFETVNDSDWYKVRLKKGQRYAIGFKNVGSESFTFTGRLHNPAGNAFSKEIAVPKQGDKGLTIRPKVSGIYFVEVQHKKGALPAQYRVSVSTDCSGGLTPECTLTLGVPRKSILTWHDDQDSFGAPLVAGKRYVLSVAGARGVNGTVYDPSGKKVTADGQTFTAAGGGRYIVLVGTTNAKGSPYDLLISKVNQ